MANRSIDDAVVLPPRSEWVLWASTLPGRSAESRIDAAAAARYGGVSIGLPDIDRMLAGDLAPADLRRRAEDRGIVLQMLEPLVTWLPVSPDSWAGHVHVDDMLGLAVELGVPGLCAIAMRGTGTDRGAWVERVADLCDRAHEVGCLVSLEPTPMSEVGDVGDAASIVQQAGRDNGGILFDTWHFFRAGADFEALSRVPGERIFHVQVSDAGPPGPNPIRDTYHRRLPGDGELDLARVMRVLRSIGALRRLGPEVISPDMGIVPAVEAAESAAQSIETLLEAAFPRG